MACILHPAASMSCAGQPHVDNGARGTQTIQVGSSSSDANIYEGRYFLGSLMFISSVQQKRATSNILFRVSEEDVKVNRLMDRSNEGVLKPFDLTLLADGWVRTANPKGGADFITTVYGSVYGDHPVYVERAFCNGKGRYFSSTNGFFVVSGVLTAAAVDSLSMRLDGQNLRFSVDPRTRFLSQRDTLAIDAPITVYAKDLDAPITAVAAGPMKVFNNDGSPIVVIPPELISPVRN